MKINLPKHYLTERTRSELQSDNGLTYLGLKEIPVGYISVDEVNKKPQLLIEPNFAEQYKIQIKPYTSFDTEDILLFDSNQNIIQKTLKRIDGKYYYEYPSQTEFSPLSFKIWLELQKKMSYYNDVVYDIKVSAIESKRDSFAENLMQLFNNNQNHKICPRNIKFNGGSTNVMTLTENNYTESDFVFIQSHDGMHYGDSNEDTDEIDIDYILSCHTNVWLFCDTYYSHLINVINDNTENLILHMSDHILYERAQYEIPRNHAILFDQDLPFNDSYYTGNQFMYINEATLIIHKEGKGYLIVTPSWFLDDLQSVAFPMYETLVQVYMQSYVKSKEKTCWITDKPVDYFSYSDTYFGKKHPDINLKDLLNINDYKIVDVRVTTPYVRYLGTDNSGNLILEKTGGTQDPEKTVTDTSIYTTKHTVIHYKQEDIWAVETPLDLEFSFNDNAVYLIVHPYISTKKKIRTISDQTFIFNDLNATYFLVVNQGSTDLVCTFNLIKSTEIMDSSLIKAATISFSLKQQITVCDTRIMGGGIPEDQPDDYDMFDIGHIFGRPYRVGGSLIIKLPMKCKAYDTRIKAELNKHIAAGDEYVIVYESRI